MARCGHCGTSLENGALSCASCGGTAIPSHAERGLQPLYSVGETLSGRFRVEQILGFRASGVVYGVHDAHTERRVALKILWERALRATLLWRGSRGNSEPPSMHPIPTA